MGGFTCMRALTLQLIIGMKKVIIQIIIQKKYY